jgi:hypothetical protein
MQRCEAFSRLSEPLRQEFQQRISQVAEIASRNRGLRNFMVATLHNKLPTADVIRNFEHHRRAPAFRTDYMFERGGLAFVELMILRKNA